jgi:hypothetical protein
MGGGDGGVIIRNSIASDLGNPVVSGMVPAHKHSQMLAVLALDPATWTMEQVCFLDDCRMCAYCAIAG